MTWKCYVFAIALAVVVWAVMGLYAACDPRREPFGPRAHPERDDE